MCFKNITPVILSIDCIDANVEAKINQEAVVRIHRRDNGLSNQSSINGHSESEVLDML